MDHETSLLNDLNWPMLGIPAQAWNDNKEDKAFLTGLKL
jgi:hypothetical protein